MRVEGDRASPPADLNGVDWVCRASVTPRSQAPGVGPGQGSSTKELKRTNVDLRPLDFRLKASWRSALEVLQQAAAAMAEWDRNPPAEYKELCAEIDQAAAAYSTSIDQGLKLSAELRRAADDMEALSGELQQEAEELKAIEQASRKQRRARSLN